MTPRRSEQGKLIYMIGEPLDDSPSEIADGIFLPFTRCRAWTTFGPYQVTVTVLVKDREQICEKLEIESRDRTPVSAVMLRTIPLADMVRQSVVTVGQPFRLDGEKRVPIATQRVVDVPRRGSKDETLVAVVEAYRRALANPATAGRATQAVADELNYQRGYVSRLLSEARSMDPPLLGPAHKGKTGERPSSASK